MSDWSLTTSFNHIPEDDSGPDWLEISPDNSTLAYGVNSTFATDEFYVINTSDWSLEETIGHEVQYHSFTNSGDYFGIGNFSVPVRIYDTSTWSEDTVIDENGDDWDYDNDSAYSIDISEDYVIVGTSDGFVHLWEFTTGDHIDTYTHVPDGDDPGDSSFHRVDGVYAGQNYIAYLNNDNGLVVRETSSFNEVFSLSGDGGMGSGGWSPSDAFNFNDTESYLAVQTTYAQVVVYDTSDWSIHSERLNYEDESNNNGEMKWVANDDLLLHNNGNNEPNLFDPYTGENIECFEGEYVSDCDGIIESSTPNGDWQIVVVDRPGDLRVYNYDGLSKISTAQFEINGDVINIPLYDPETIDNPWIRFDTSNGVAAALPVDPSGQRLRTERPSTGSTWGIETE